MSSCACFLGIFLSLTRALNFVFLKSRQHPKHIYNYGIFRVSHFRFAMHFILKKERTWRLSYSNKRLLFLLLLFCYYKRKAQVNGEFQSYERQTSTHVSRWIGFICVSGLCIMFAHVLWNEARILTLYVREHFP